MKFFNRFSYYRDKNEDVYVNLGVSWIWDRYVNVVPSQETQSFLSKVGWGGPKGKGISRTFTFYLYTRKYVRMFTIDFSTIERPWTTEELKSAPTEMDKYNERMKTVRELSKRLGRHKKTSNNDI